MGCCLIAGLIACSQNGDVSVSIVKHAKDNEYHIHLKEIKDSVSIKLSDIISDFEILPLETNDECLLSRGMYYISKEYILVQKYKHGILQFDRKGKFIRTLVQQGQGPTEYSRASWTIDEEKQILYLSDYSKENYFLQFDLHSGTYLGDLMKAIPVRNDYIELSDQGELIVVPVGRFVNYCESYYLYWQDTEGKLLAGIAAPDDLFLRHAFFSGFGSLGRYQKVDDDTIYTVHNQELIPFVTMDFGVDVPDSKDQEGYQWIGLEYETPSWLAFSSRIISKIEVNGNSSFTSTNMSLHALDKKNGKAYHRKDLFLCPTHHSLNNYQDQYAEFQQNGIFYYAYQAIDLIEQAEIALADLDFAEPYRSKLEEVLKTISENDNPYLLIGQIK